MKNFCTFFYFLLLFHSLDAQKDQKIIKTDSSIIKINKSITGKWIEEHLNDRNLIHFKKYFKDNKTLKSDYYTDSSTLYKNRLGIGKYYNENGELYLTLNFDRPDWIPAVKSDYPHYDLLKKMKSKADSILEGMFSIDFINNHLKWSISGSNYWDKTYEEPNLTISWVKKDSHKYNPTEFYLSYDILLEGRKYENAVRLLIDLKGNILNYHRWNSQWTVYNKGLEKLDFDSQKNLRISREKAILTAFEYGLRPSNSQNARGSMVWVQEEDESSSVFNGNWKYYLLVPKPNDSGRETYGKIKVSYTVYIFNPWNEEFLEKKSMYKEYSYFPGITFSSNRLIEEE